jgi:hypothetical protein
MRPEYSDYVKEKPHILQFLCECTAPKDDGHAYVSDLRLAYCTWRKANGMRSSQLSIHSFARALPKTYKRKLLHRGRSLLGPARALLGVVIR